MAAEQTGFDGKGLDGLQGYLRQVAQSEPRAFMGLLGKVLPLELNGQVRTTDAATKEQRDAAVAAALLAAANDKAYIG